MFELAQVDKLKTVKETLLTSFIMIQLSALHSSLPMTVSCKLGNFNLLQVSTNIQYKDIYYLQI